MLPHQPEPGLAGRKKKKKQKPRRKGKKEIKVRVSGRKEGGRKKLKEKRT